MDQSLPKHVAVIPDGNRRWAKLHGLPAWEGHRRGFERAMEISKKARDLDIRIFTLWGFSTENWRRSSTEISFLMDMFLKMLRNFRKDAMKEQVRIVHLGKKDRIPKKLAHDLASLENDTARYNRYYLNIAIDYGGRDEILRTISKLKTKQPLSLEIFEKNLDTGVLPYPDVDLIIRTSGEMRLSGFMPWQSVYAEMLFLEKHFPDFTKDDFEKCIKDYAKRKRRLGR